MVESRKIWKACQFNGTLNPVDDDGGWMDARIEWDRRGEAAEYCIDGGMCYEYPYSMLNVKHPC